MRVVQTVSSTERAGLRARLAAYACCFLLALVGAYLVMLAVFTAGTVPPGGSDFAVYYAAAEILRYSAGPDIYSWGALQHITQLHGGCPMFTVPGYVYPPLLAILLEPLAHLSCAQAILLWHLLNLALWAGSAALLADLLYLRWQGASRLLALAVMAVLTVASFNALKGYWLGQVHIVLLFGFVLALWLDDRRLPVLAGAVLATIALLKLLPAFVLVYYLLQGRWRVLAGAALGGVLLCLGMVATAGLPVVLGSIAASSGAVVSQVKPGLDEALVVAVPGGHLLVWAVGCAYLAGMVLARGRGERLLGYGWALCTMLLLSPLVWQFYLIWLLPATMACLAAVPSLPHLPRLRQRWPLLATLVATLVAIQVLLASPLLLLTRPLATLVLWLLTGGLFLRSAMRQRPATSDDRPSADVCQAIADVPPVYV